MSTPLSGDSCIDNIITISKSQVVTNDYSGQTGETSIDFSKDFKSSKADCSSETGPYLVQGKGGGGLTADQTKVFTADGGTLKINLDEAKETAYEIEFC